MRARLLAAAVAALVAATGLLRPLPAHAAPVTDGLDQQNAVVATGSAVAKSDVWLAQTFTAGATGTLTKVQLDLKHDNGFAGDTQTSVSIFPTDDAGSPTGSTLGTVSVDASSVATIQAIVTFSGYNVPVTAGTKYALVLGTNGADGPHSVFWFHSGDNGYAAGSAYTGPSTWTANAGIDRRFVTYVSYENTAPTCSDVGPVATTKNTPVVVTLSCTDPQAFQHLTYTRTAAAHGTLQSVPGQPGSYTYTPAADYAGPDQFTYHASDGHEVSSERTVTLTVGAAATPPSPPTVAVAGKPDTDTKKGTAELTVSVSAPGTVTISGKGLKTASATVAQAGQVTLTVKPDAKTKKKLKDKHKATVTVTVTVTPPGSATPSSTATQKVKLKKKQA